MARNRTPLSAGTSALGTASSCAGPGAAAGGARALAGRALRGRSAAPQDSWASASRSATLVCKELAALLYAPSLIKARARRALAPWVGAPRSAAWHRARWRQCSSARSNKTANCPLAQSCKRRASSSRTLTPRGAGPKSNLDRASSWMHASTSPSAIRLSNPASTVACRMRWSTGTCSTVADGKRRTRAKNSA